MTFMTVDFSGPFYRSAVNVLPTTYVLHFIRVYELAVTIHVSIHSWRMGLLTFACIDFSTQQQKLRKVLRIQQATFWVFLLMSKYSMAVTKSLSLPVKMVLSHLHSFQSNEAELRFVEKRTPNSTTVVWCVVSRIIPVTSVCQIYF